jgi:hypothetical protein
LAIVQDSVLPLSAAGQLPLVVELLKAAALGLVFTAAGTTPGANTYTSASPLPPEVLTFSEVFPAGTTTA